MGPPSPRTGAQSGSATQVADADVRPDVLAATSVARRGCSGGSAGTTPVTLAAANVVHCVVPVAATPVGHADAVACCRCSAG